MLQFFGARARLMAHGSPSLFAIGRGIGGGNLRMNHSDCVRKYLRDSLFWPTFSPPCLWLRTSLSIYVYIRHLYTDMNTKREECTSFVFLKITKSIKLLARNLNINPSYAMWHTYREARTSCKWWVVDGWYSIVWYR